MPASLRIAAVVLLLTAGCVTARSPFTAPPPDGPPALDAEAAARILVLVVPDADPRLPPQWLEHAEKAAGAVEAALREARFRTTREPLSRWSARVTVSCPIRGADFSIAIEARHKVVERLDLNGRDWGPAERAELAKVVRQRLERSEAIAALAGVAPRKAEVPAPGADPALAGTQAAPAAAPAPPSTGRPQRRLAVLDFRGAVAPTVLVLLADQARAAAADAGRISGTTVITRERVLAILKERGRSTDPCGDGACEVEAARAVGADLVVTGEVSEVGGARFLVLKLVDTGSGALLVSRHAQAADDLALVEAARLAASALFE